METTLRAAGVQYRLLICGDGTVRTVPLHGLRWVIGRALDCTIPLRDPTVSRRHLLIERHGNEFRFQDLGGSNPVLLDGKVANQGAVTAGQTLSIGMTRLILEQRNHPAPLTTQPGSTVVLSREVVDEELQLPISDSASGTAARILDRIEWTFADLGDLADAADPLLTLAMNLSGRTEGWIGRFNAFGSIETLASVSASGATSISLPEGVLAEARRIPRPHLLTTQEGEAAHNRLVIPLGTGPEALLVLETPDPGAPQGQELLRLAQSLGKVIWHRLQETTERLRLRDELQRLRFHGSATHNALLASARLNDVRQSLRNLSGSTSPILLVGEEGTEREALARYLHAESPRRQAAFHPWDAARVPEWRHERDLFGDQRDRGLLRRSAGGTLFLDNVQALAASVWNRLVEELARDDFEPSRPALVLATGPQSELTWPEAAATRLAPERLVIPPLRNEPRDVLALAELFLSEMGGGPDGNSRLLTERTKRVLAGYGWPGNVRELRLVLESAAAQAGNQPIAPRHLPPPLDADTTAANPEIATLDEIERQHIQAVMTRTGGNRTRAAQILGIANSTLYDKLKRYGIGD